MAKGMNKSEFVAALAEKAGLEKKQVNAVLEAISMIAAGELKGARELTVPGLVKLRAVHKPATPAGTKPNPFRPGEMMEVKAKPAKQAVKASPIKALKDAVA